MMSSVRRRICSSIVTSVASHGRLSRNGPLRIARGTAIAVRLRYPLEEAAYVAVGIERRGDEIATAAGTRAVRLRVCEDVAQRRRERVRIVGVDEHARLAVAHDLGDAREPRRYDRRLERERLEDQVRDDVHRGVFGDRARE